TWGEHRSTGILPVGTTGILPVDFRVNRCASWAYEKEKGPAAAGPLASGSRRQPFLDASTGKMPVVPTARMTVLQITLRRRNSRADSSAESRARDIGQSISCYQGNNPTPRSDYRLPRTLPDLHRRR